MFFAGSYYSNSFTFAVKYGTSQMIPNSAAGTGIGTYDGFLGKWNEGNDSVVWLDRFGNSGGNEAINGMVLDKAGNIYVAGFFSSATAYPVGLVNTLYPSNEAFVAKMLVNGNAGWAVRFGFIYNDEAMGIAMSSAQDALFVTGYFTGNVSFGGIVMNTTVNATDVFVVKMSITNGAVQWALQMGGDQADLGYAIAWDPTTQVQQGSLIVVGYTNSPTFVAGNYSLTTNGGNDGFIVRINPTGNVTFASIIGGSGADTPMLGLAIDNTTGNIYTSGNIASSSLVFAGATVTNPSGTLSVIDVMKFAPDGTQLWVKLYGGSGDNYCQSLGMNMVTKTLYIGATMGSTSMTFNGVIVTNRLFVFSMDTSGNAISATSLNFSSITSSLNIVRATWVNPTSGDVWIGGGFDNADTLWFNGITMTEYGQQDAFVARFNSSLTQAPYYL